MGNQAEIETIPAPVIKPRDIGVLFRGEMVNAIADGRKTKTRRLVKWPENFRWPLRGPTSDRLDNLGDSETVVATDLDGKHHYIACPYGRTDDTIWVRETARLASAGPNPGEFALTFAADLGKMTPPLARVVPAGGKNPFSFTRWTPGIHMPRWASRLDLKVSDYASIERLRDITDEEAIAEGFVCRDSMATGRHRVIWGLPEWQPGACFPTPRGAFLQYVTTINKIPSSSNPWVWVVSFRRA